MFCVVVYINLLHLRHSVRHTRLQHASSGEHTIVWADQCVATSFKHTPAANRTHDYCGQRELSCIHCPGATESVTTKSTYSLNDTQGLSSCQGPSSRFPTTDYCITLCIFPITSRSARFFLAGHGCP